MARTVREIMNGEVLTLPPDMGLSDAADLLRSFGVGAAPVVDEARRPIGVLSVRDVLGTGRCVRDRMTRPALCVPAAALVEDAARQLAATPVHHLVVVDSAGQTAGMLSTLDLLRALLGMPTPHPSAFPHWDAVTATSWSDDRTLDQSGARAVPDGPGLLVLLTSFIGEPDSLVWVEASEDLRARALAMVGSPKSHEPALVKVLARTGLRFRVASVADATKRQGVLAVLRDRLDHAPRRGVT